MQPVTIYSTQVCAYCARAKALLTAKQAPFTEIFIDLEPEKRAEMLRKSGGRRTVPQIFIGDRHVGGFDDLYALEQKGELDSLLQP